MGSGDESEPEDAFERSNKMIRSPQQQLIRSNTMPSSSTGAKKRKAIDAEWSPENSQERCENVLGHAPNVRAELEMLLSDPKIGKSITVGTRETVRKLFTRMEESVQKLTVKVAMLEGRLMEREARIEKKLNQVLEGTREAVSEAAIAAEVMLNAGRQQDNNRCRRGSVRSYVNAAKEKKQILIVTGG